MWGNDQCRVTTSHGPKEADGRSRGCQRHWPRMESAGRAFCPPARAAIGGDRL